MAVPGKKAHKFSSSTISKGSDEDIKLLCQPCDSDGSKLPAYGYCMDCKEHLCENCFKFHKKATPCRNHRLLDKSSMPQTQQLSGTTAQGVLSDDLTTPCSKHKREMIKLYCYGHKALLCTICVTLEHNTCLVSYIPDISGQTVDSNEFQNILKTIDGIIGNCQKLTTDLKKMTAQSNNSLTDALDDIRNFRKEINQKIDELEKAATEAAKSLQLENDRKLKTTEAACDDVIKSLATSSDFLKQLNSSKQADKLFMELKNAEQLIKDYEYNISQLPTYESVNEYAFEHNSAISALLETEKSFGTLVNKASRHLSTTPPHIIKPRQASNLGEICMKTGQRTWCCIPGMALLSPDCLVVTDKADNSIKMIDTNRRSITTQLRLDTYPWGICTVGRNMLAVTQPNKQTIQFISDSSDKLVKKHTLKVDGNCYAISCYQEKLVVTFEGPAKVQILNMKGTILTTVKTNHSSEDIFHGPEHVVTNSSSIYVSDVSKNTVYRLNWQGEVIGSYKSVDCPRGVTLSEDGSIFLCADKNNNVIEILSDCSRGKLVLQTPTPLALCWCAEQKKLYISSIVSTGVLQIYKLS